MPSRSPDLIEIDVEGAELLAVTGAPTTLLRASPALIAAVHPDGFSMATKLLNQRSKR
jgi:hypothetical protein